MCLINQIGIVDSALMENTIIVKMPRSRILMSLLIFVCTGVLRVPINVYFLCYHVVISNVKTREEIVIQKKENERVAAVDKI